MDRLWNLLKNVTSEIFETMFFLFIEPPQAQVDPELLAQWQGSGVQARINLTGPQSFGFGLTLPLPLGQEMADNFLGGGDTADSLAVVDVIKECANMIGGSLLTHLQNAAAYQLSIPQGDIVDLGRIPAQGPLTQLLNVNGFPVGIFLEAGK